VRARATASSLATLAQQIGLVAMPLLAQFAMLQHGLARRLAGARRGDAAGRVCPDLAVAGAPARKISAAARRRGGRTRSGRAMRAAEPEPAFSRRQALRTGSFWLLCCIPVLVYPVQAGSACTRRRS
jgi:hypothetical protein